MTAASFAALVRIGPVVTTGEAAAALTSSLSHASRTLRGLASRGLARKLRYGLWIVGTDPIDPLTLANEITRPYPSYVSFLSALSVHGMIDQVPREVSLASLDAARRVATSVGTYAVHHLPAALFGGWTLARGVKLARPEKAIFDIAYVSAVHLGRPRRIPELELPRKFERAELGRWLRHVSSARLRTLTKLGIDAALARALR